MPQITVKDANNNDVSIETQSPDGRAAASASKPVTLATEDKAALDAIKTAVDATTEAVNALDLEFPSSMAVTGDFFPDTQPVSIDTPVEVTGEFFPPTQAVSIADTVDVAVETLPLPAGAATAAGVSTVATAVNALRGTEYETVAAGQTAQVLGTTGAIGDFLESLLVIPSSLSPGPIVIRDGAAGALITVFAGGADSLSTLHPFSIPLGVKALAAGWRVTTGEGASVFATGNFT